MMFYRIAQKFTKYLGYFCKKFDIKNFENKAQYVHNAHELEPAENFKHLMCDLGHFVSLHLVHHDYNL